MVDEPLVLYTRADCHLCDQVMTMLNRAGIGWRPVDIDRDPELVNRYGLRVPVLQRQDTREELFFPFGEEELRRFAPGAEGDLSRLF